MSCSKSTRRIIFFTVHAAFFVSHRLNLALAAREQGYEILILYGAAGSNDMTVHALETLTKMSLPHRELNFNARRVNVSNLLRGALLLRSEILRFAPTIVHAISTMPIVLTLLATFGVRCRRVFAVSGLGAVSTLPYFFIVRSVINFLSVRRDVFIFQNSSDCGALDGGGYRVVTLPGSGVQRKEFELEKKERVVLLAARLMKKKGVEIFCAVAAHVRRRDPTIRFVLAGAADYDHRDAITTDELIAYEGFRDIEYVGYRDDIECYFRQASVILYPSTYAEGLSKALIEGAMYGCVICTFNRPGCREAVVDRITGVLLSEGSTVPAIAEIIFGLLSTENQGSLIKMMERANQMALENFSIDFVTEKHLQIYNDDY